MVNLKLIYKIIGSLLFLLGSLLLICTGVSLYYKEDDLVAFLISAIFTICCGFVMKYFGSEANNNLSRRDSYLLVTSTWVIFSLFGMLPFIISGYIPSITDAFFETMSGFSTTGATILDDVESMPHATLYWRTQTQWIGGLGIVFFTIAILPSMVGSGSNDGQVDLDSLSGTDHCLHPGFLCRRYGLVQQYQLCDDNHRYGRFCYP